MAERFVKLGGTRKDWVLAAESGLLVERSKETGEQWVLPATVFEWRRNSSGNIRLSAETVNRLRWKADHFEIGVLVED